MRILLVNVPHPSIGSRIPDDHLPPLGLLSIGGPLIDDRHDVPAAAVAVCAGQFVRGGTRRQLRHRFEPGIVLDRDGECPARLVRHHYRGKSG